MNLMRMRSVISILFFLAFSSCKGSGVTEQHAVKEDTILLISGEAVNANGCSRKCIRISDADVQFDDCYDQDAGIFQKDCEADLGDKEIYRTLLHVDATFWEELENEIDENHDANAGLPFVITLTSKGETKSYILLKVNLQNEKYGTLMKQLEHLFNNWENCDKDQGNRKK